MGGKQKLPSQSLQLSLQLFLSLNRSSSRHCTRLCSCACMSLSCHSERSEEPPHFAFAFAVALAPRYGLRQFYRLAFSKIKKEGSLSDAIRYRQDHVSLPIDNQRNIKGDP